MKKISYIKIQNFWETDEKRTLEDDSTELIIEEKLDGKTFDGVSACLNAYHNIYLCFFGEYLETTHLIRYENLPNNIILFDVGIYNDNSQTYLPPKIKLIFSSLVGIPNAPIRRVLEKYQKEEIDRYYLSERSYFKTDLNQKVCENFPDLCKNFKAKYGEKNFSEGVVVKKYKDGEIKAVKYVKPEFDKIIKIIGRYENYPGENIITFDLEGAIKLQEQNMKEVGMPPHLVETFLKLFKESYPISFRANDIDEIYNKIPEKK